EPVLADLAKMPHLLIAGTTGSGKSVGINTMILSILYRMPPERCKFIMVDPKMLELSVYYGIPHLLAPVVSDPKKAVLALKWTVREMESRYQKMSKLGVRNIEGFNTRLREAAVDGESLVRKVLTGFDPETGQPVFEEEPFDPRRGRRRAAPGARRHALHGGRRPRRAGALAVRLRRGGRARRVVSEDAWRPRLDRRNHRGRQRRRARPVRRRRGRRFRRQS